MSAREFLFFTLISTLYKIEGGGIKYVMISWGGMESRQITGLRNAIPHHSHYPKIEAPPFPKDGASILLLREDFVARYLYRLWLRNEFRATLSADRLFLVLAKEVSNDGGECNPDQQVESQPACIEQAVFDKSAFFVEDDWEARSRDVVRAGIRPENGGQATVREQMRGQQIDRQEERQSD